VHPITRQSSARLTGPSSTLQTLRTPIIRSIPEIRIAAATGGHSIMGVDGRGQISKQIAPARKGEPFRSAERFHSAHIHSSSQMGRERAVTRTRSTLKTTTTVTNRAKIAIAKELESIPLGFFLQAKRDFDSGEKEFQVNFVVTNYFR